MKFSRKVENLIANLRSLPENEGRSIARQTRKIDSLIEVVLGRYKVGQPRPETVVMQHWQQIVGEANAHCCHPQRIVRHHRLIVAVANPTLRQELVFQSSVFLNRLRRLPGCEQIDDIYFTIGR